MKKKNLLLMILVLAMVVSSLAGCSKNNSENTTSTKNNSIVTALTAPMGSGWHAFTVLLSDIYMDLVPGLNFNVLEGGSIGNIKAISGGVDANFGWAYTTDLRDAYKGEGAFTEVYSDALPIAVTYPVWLNVLTLDNGKITSIAQLKDARINVGAVGTGSELAAKRMLEAYGFTYDSIKTNGGQISYGSYSDGSTQLSDGIVEAIMGGGSPNIPAYSEVSQQNKCLLLPVSEEAANNLLAKDYGYTISEIPANTYVNQPEAVSAVTYQSVLIVNKDMNEELVYQLVKGLWESMDRIRKEQPARGNLMSIDTALEGINVEDLHPGAAKYYKEVGLIK